MLRVALVMLSFGAFAQGAGANASTRPRLALEAAEVQPDQTTAMQDQAASLLARIRIAPHAADLARAETLINRLLTMGAPRAEALNAWRLLIGHRFDEALAAPRRARTAATDPLLAAVSEADALTELGRYDEAETAVQTLLDNHYGIAALARASHLRMVFGDLAGAMELAAVAISISPAGVHRAWLQLDLAELQLMAGTPAQALTLALAPVADLPAPTLAAQARAHAALGNAPAALALYRLAATTTARAETLLEVMRLAHVLGEQALARRTAAVLDGMARLDATGTGGDRRCFVEFYGERGEVITAEALARAEWRQRPGIQSAAQLAWVLHRADKLGEARGKTLMAAAVARDARLASGASSVALRR